MDYGGSDLHRKAHYVFFDTGTSFNLAPIADIESIMKKLQVGGTYIPFNHAQKMQNFACSDDDVAGAEDITFKLPHNGYKYTIPVANWLQKDGPRCTIKLMWDLNETDNWILGLNFF